MNHDLISNNNKYLNILEYKNYGFKLKSVQDSSNSDNFHFSVFRLSNKKIIVLEYVEYLRDNKFESNDYFFNYLDLQLKDGKKVEYQFNMSFDDFFDNIPKINEVELFSEPTEIEEKSIKYYLMNTNQLSNGRILK